MTLSSSHPHAHALKQHLLDHDRTIIKRATLKQLTQSETILHEGRLKAAKILKEARIKAREEITKGREDGLRQAQSDMAEQMIQTAAAAVDYMNHLECSVTELVMDAIEKILDDMADEKKVRALVRKALKNLGNNERIRIRVAKEDEIHLKTAIVEGDWQENSAIIDIVKDSSLPRGSAILESQLGVVDASLDVQLQAIRKGLNNLFKTP